VIARGGLGVVACAALAALAFAAPASAQSAADAAAADALFSAAQKLAAAGKYEEACPKYAESLRLDSGIGVMLYLADCWERTGKTASAWAQFREAEQLASTQGDKRAVAAYERATRLEPNLARLVIRVGPGADVPGLDVKRDTTEVGRPQWGVSVPVDPGQHTVRVTATGKKPRQIAVSALAGTPPTVLEVTPLEDAGTGPPAPWTVGTVPAALPDRPPASPVDDAHPGLTQRSLAFVAGGVGLVGLVVGSYFGFDTISKNNASNSSGCTAGSTACTNGNAVNLRSEAKSSGLISTVAFAAGAVFVAGGVVLYLTAPRASSPVTVGFAPSLDGRGGAAIFSRPW
jgi:hypothetical protein